MVRARISRAVEAGALAGLGLAALDVAAARAGYASWGERAALWGAIATLLVAAGAGVGLVIGIADGAGRPTAGGRSLRLAMVAAPAWIAVGIGLGGAPAVRSHLGGAGPALGAIALALASLVGARLLLAVIARASSPRRERGIAAVAGALVIALFLLDALSFRRRQAALHGLLLGGEFAFAALAAALLRRRAPVRPTGGGVRAFAIVALAPLSFALQHLSENVRFIVHEQTVAARQVTGVVGALLPARRRPAVAAPRAAHAPRVPLPEARDAHLVLITIDALRPDHLGAWGYPRRVNGEPLSPAIDALAAAGVRFERVYTAAPHSAYAISSLLTSEYIPSTVRLGLPAPPTLADLLGARGFRTEAWFPLGLFFNGRKELAAFAERRFGFQRATTWDLDARTLTDHVIERLDEIHREGEPRTFLWIHYFDVHEPYVRHPDFDLGPSAMQRYDSEIAFTDRQLARLFAALANLDRPTVIALTADHGEEFKEHGGWYHGSSLYEEQVRVPLIVVAPGLAPRAVADPVELVDVAPMLLSLLGEPPAPSQRGDDLSPALTGSGAPTRPVFSEVDNKRMVRRGRWKLVVDVRRDTSELYDLETDPRELANVYDRHPSIGAELDAELRGWMESLRAPAGREPAALAMARLGDKRAVVGLATVVGDGTQPTAVRAEAARLAGALEGYDARPSLRAQLATPDRPCDALCAEAALALGELTDKRAVPTLVRLLDEPRYRRRAGVMLGRLRDPRAQDALLEAIADPDVELRRKAAHYLSFIGDARAIAPLEARLDDVRARDLVAVALARIGARTGDRSVLPLLLDRLAKERFEDDRAYEVCALGLLGDRSSPRADEALAVVLAAAVAEPPVKWATETLVRLGAVDGRHVGGVDFAPDAAGLDGGFDRCARKGRESTDDYAGDTTCFLAAVGRLHFPLAAPVEGEVALRVRPEGDGGTITVVINGTALPPAQLPPGWRELRLPTPRSRWRVGRNDVELRLAGTPSAEVDHLLLLPRR